MPSNADDVPQEIKGLIDSTAQFVARHGPTFEAKILQTEGENPKFLSFLVPNSPYSNYYKKRVREFLASFGKFCKDVANFTKLAPTGKISSADLKDEKEDGSKVEKKNSMDDIDEDLPSNIAGAPINTTSQPARKGPTSLAQIVVSVVSKLKERSEPLQDFPDLFVTPFPSEITAMDLDVIKLTAQFVARNGHQFQVGLMNREQKNPQFDFLKQNHPHHSFYLSLVESYTRCLLPPKNFPANLREMYSNKKAILERIIEKFEVRKQEKLKQAEEEQKQKESQQNVQINWNEFVIVEQIDFTEEEEAQLQRPTHTEIKIPIAPATQAAEMDTDDMEVESEEPIRPTQMELRVRKDYVRPNVTPAKRGPVQYQICPRCGQQVPIEEFDFHLKQELQANNPNQAPKYDPSKVNIAPDTDISKTLKDFAKRRTDIFGQEETAIGKTINPEPKPAAQEEKTPPTTWDTSTPARTLVPPPPAKPPIQLLPPESIGTMNSQPPMGGFPEQGIGILPTPPSPIISKPPMAMPPPPPHLPNASTLVRAPVQYVAPVMPVQPPPPPVAEPPAKKQKLNEEESKLIPEEEFIQKQGPGPITIKVQVPTDEKAENMKGQVLSFQMLLKSTITDLKEKIKAEIGLAPNKQKIKTESLGVLRDQQSLAYYNFTDGTVLALDKKERGGKAKKK